MLWQKIKLSFKEFVLRLNCYSGFSESDSV